MIFLSGKKERSVTPGGAGMALSIEEQRLLSEIASRLSEEDPRLADRLSTLGRTRQRRRIRIIAALVVAVLVIAAAIATAVAVAMS
jgi:hypothetical protein